MKRFGFGFALLSCLCLLPGRAAAGPVVINFNVAGYGPTDETQQTFTKVDGSLPTITFESLDEALAAQGYLHWDADDGNGFGDGFGVRDFPGLYSDFPGDPADGQTYSQDEIEGNERLRLTFSSGVQLLSFNVTDLFFEDESNQTGLPVCVAADQQGCYRETGEYSLDGGATWFGFIASLGQIRNSSNGILTIPVNQFTTSLILRAPGAVSIEGFPYTQLQEFSLAGIEIDEQDLVVTPEPSSLLLLGSAFGAYGLNRWRKRGSKR